METRRETQKQIQQRRAARRRRRLLKYTIPRALFALLLIAVIAILIACMSTDVTGGGAGADETTAGTETSAETQSPETTEQTEASTEPAVFFKLTAEERTLIEQVVSAESRGEPYDGQVAVAQCILNACLKDDIRPEAVLKKYHYTTARAEPTSSVRAAVAAVFDRGEGVTDEPIIYFYNPNLCESEFHESQIFVIEIQNHRFFKEGPSL